MKIILMITCMFFSLAVNAGPYIELGLGWLQDLPVKASREVYIENQLQVRLEDQAIVAIESPFTRLTFGYRFTTTNIHVEYNQIGVIGDTENSITSVQVYKRWEWL